MLPIVSMSTTTDYESANGLNSAALLPDDAVQPDGGFAGLFRLADPAADHGDGKTGEALPADGKSMPVPIPAPIPVQVPLALPVPAPLQGTPAKASAAAAATAGAFAPRIEATAGGLPGAVPRPIAEISSGAPGTASADAFVGPGTMQGRNATGPDSRRALPAATGPAADAPSRDGKPVITEAGLVDALRGRPGSQRAAPAVPAGADTAALSREAASVPATGNAALPEPGEPAQRSPEQARLATEGRAPITGAAAGVPATAGATTEAGNGAAQMPRVEAGNAPAAASSQPAHAQAAPAIDAVPRMPQVQASLPIPVTDPAWADNVGERVVMMANHRLQNAEIRLSPPDMGPLRIQVSVDDGSTNVSFTAGHAATRDVIEQALPRLRELFADAGLTLGEAAVGADTSSHGEREPAAGDAVPEPAGGDADAGPADGKSDGAAVTRAARGLVDTFA